MPKGPTGRQKFTPEEDQAILQGFEKYKGKYNKWTMIQNDPIFGAILSTRDRNNGNIKDRYRTLTESKAVDDLKASFYSTGIEEIHEQETLPVGSVIQVAAHQRFQGWDKSETRAIAELLERHDNGKSIRYILEKARKDYVQKLGNKTDGDIMNMLSALKSSPELSTEEPFPICLKCRKYTQLDGEDGEVELPQNDTGNQHAKFMLVCKFCQRTSIMKLRAFFSPRSGCTLARQVNFLEFLYDTQLTPYFAAEMIHMDHDPLYKSKAFSDLKTIGAYVAEVLQGRCTPILSEEHNLISRRCSSRIPNPAKRKKDLTKSRKTLEKKLTPERLAAIFGDDFSLDGFKRSGIFWGVDKCGERRCFDKCRKALEDKWKESLNQADAGNDEQSLMLRWFIKLGHDRAKVVHCNVEEEQLPSDYVQVANLLEKWKVQQPQFLRLNAPKPINTNGLRTETSLMH